MAASRLPAIRFPTTPWTYRIPASTSNGQTTFLGINTDVGALFNYNGYYSVWGSISTGFDYDFTGGSGFGIAGTVSAQLGFWFDSTGQLTVYGSAGASIDTWAFGQEVNESNVNASIYDTTNLGGFSFDQLYWDLINALGPVSEESTLSDGKRTPRHPRASEFSSRSGASQSDVTRQADSRKLPPCLGRKEVAVRGPDVRPRRGARAAPKDELVAHELAVILTDRSRRRPEPPVRSVRALRPFPDVAEELGRDRRPRVC